MTQPPMKLLLFFQEDRSRSISITSELIINTKSQAQLGPLKSTFLVESSDESYILIID